MSNRKRSYKSVGGGVGYDGKSFAIRCDGKRHYRMQTMPKQSQSYGVCNCKQFMDAIQALLKAS